MERQIREIGGSVPNYIFVAVCQIEKFETNSTRIRRWKDSGTCTYTFKDGDKISDAWEEGSHLKEYIYKYTGGTCKY